MRLAVGREDQEGFVSRIQLDGSQGVRRLQVALHHLVDFCQFFWSEPVAVLAFHHVEEMIGFVFNGFLVAHPKISDCYGKKGTGILSPCQGKA